MIERPTTIIDILRANDSGRGNFPDGLEVLDRFDQELYPQIRELIPFTLGVPDLEGEALHDVYASLSRKNVEGLIGSTGLRLKANALRKEKPEGELINIMDGNYPGENYGSVSRDGVSVSFRNSQKNSEGKVEIDYDKNRGGEHYYKGDYYDETIIFRHDRDERSRRLSVLLGDEHYCIVSEQGPNRPYHAPEDILIEGKFKDTYAGKITKATIQITRTNEKFGKK